MSQLVSQSSGNQQNDSGRLSTPSRSTNDSLTLPTAPRPNLETIDGSVYERTQHFDRCGRVCSTTWDNNIRQFRLNEGKLEVRTVYGNGEISWQSVDSMQVGGKPRFAVEHCVYRDGKVFDRNGKEIELEQKFDEKTFGEKSLAVAWGKTGSAHQGIRLIINRAPSIGTYDELSPSPSDPFYNNEPSPSDLPYNPPVEIQRESVCLRENVYYQDRCGRWSSCCREVPKTVAIIDGKLHETDSKGANSKLLDLKRFGVKHLHLHDGRYFDSESGKEITFQYKITPEQLADKPFFQFRGNDGAHYFVSEGLPPDRTVKIQQLVQYENIPGSDGVCRTTPIYTLRRQLVQAGEESIQYELSQDGKKLSGFQAVENGETHPQFGKLVFSFQSQGADLIRVYERQNSYSGFTEYTFAKREDKCSWVRDENGCCHRRISSNWVEDPNLAVKNPAVDYNPPALLRPYEETEEELELRRREIERELETDPETRRPTINTDSPNSRTEEMDFILEDPFLPPIRSRDPVPIPQ